MAALENTVPFIVERAKKYDWYAYDLQDNPECSICSQHNLDNVWKSLFPICWYWWKPSLCVCIDSSEYLY